MAGEKARDTHLDDGDRGVESLWVKVDEYGASLMTHGELLAEFPDLTEEDIRACLAFAADRERKLATLPA